MKQAPVPHTCKDIDATIEVVDGFKKTLEKLRESNRALRSWGYELYQKNLELNKQLNNKL